MKYYADRLMYAEQLVIIHLVEVFTYYCIISPTVNILLAVAVMLCKRTASLNMVL